MTVARHAGRCCAIISGVDTVTIAVRVQPRAGRDEVVAVRDGVTIIRVAAPALEGRANRALCRFIAARVGVAPSRVSVIRGERSAHKVVRVEGVEDAVVRAALAP